MSEFFKNPFFEKIVLSVVALAIAGVASMGTSFILFRYQIPAMRSDVNENTERIVTNERAISDINARIGGDKQHFNDHIDNADNLLQKITAQLDQINGSQRRIELLANTTATRQEGLISDIDELKEEVKEMRRTGRTPE